MWFPGITALVALGILEQLEVQGLVRPLHEMAHNSVEYLHTLIEALRFALDTFTSFSCFRLPVGHNYSLAFAGTAPPSTRFFSLNPGRFHVVRFGPG